jgi:putative membrane protein
MRTIKLILLGIILLGIVVLAVANRGMVTVRLLPEGLERLVPGAALELPLFVVSLLSIVTGMVIGYLLEWLREHRYRRRAAEKEREAARLSREVANMRKDQPKDDVLALLGN